MPAWALTEDVKARRNRGAMNDLENIFKNSREWNESTLDQPSEVEKR